MTELVRTVVLHGALKKEFGSSFRVVGDTLPLLCRGINSQKEGFLDALRSGYYKVKVNGRYLSKEEAMMHISSKVKRIDITPHVGGSSGAGKAIVGAIIIGFAIVASGGTLAAPLAAMGTTAFGFAGAAVTWGNIALLGLAIGAAGVSMMMSPMPEGNAAGAGAEQRASFLFNGATNVNEQGGPVPVVYGRMRVGSTRISVDASVEEVPGTTSGSPT